MIFWSIKLVSYYGILSAVGFGLIGHNNIKGVTCRKKNRCWLEWCKKYTNNKKNRRGWKDYKRLVTKVRFTRTTYYKQTYC